MNNRSALPGSVQLEDELLALLGRQARRVPFPVFLITVIVAALASRYVPMVAWATWLGAANLVLVLRWFLLPWLASNSEMPLQKRLRAALILSLANGIAHGSALAFFPFFPDFERALQTMFITGLCTGAVATTAGYRPFYFAFFIPTLVPLFLLWAFSTQTAANGWINISVAILVAIFGAILIALANDSFRLFRESFEIRSEQAKLNEKLRVALAEADAAGRAKTRFLASASHDLRQPLHTLSLFGAALAMRPLDDRSREIAQQMDVALQALASQFDALLDVSRLDAGVVEVNSRTFRLNGLVERAVNEFEPLAREKKLELKLHCPADIYVRSDEALLERVLVNLLSNAVKYTDTGNVYLSLSANDGNCTVRVADTGKGIPAEEQNRIYEEFYQIGNPQRDRREGFGLGLSIVRRLTGLLEIEISMESKVGVGTTFTLTLPVAEETENAASASGKQVSLAGLTILAVDDEIDVALGTKTLLEEMGCNVTIVDGTPAAIAAAEVTKPDIVLADFRLRSGDDGISCIEAVRNIHPAMPAILISGDTDPSRIREASMAGLQLLHKPVVVDELRQAIADSLNLPEN